MLSHSDLWSAIDALARRHGYSVSGLAKAAGLDPTTFNKSKRIADGKLRWPSTESLSKILAVTKSSLSDLATLMHGSEANTAINRTLPLLRLDHLGLAGVFTAKGIPDRAAPEWDAIALPAAAEGCYALEVMGDSLSPIYRDGDRLIVQNHDLETGALLRRGDRMVVILKPNIPTEQPTYHLGDLVRQSAARLTVRSLHADAPELDLDLRLVAWVARVLWASQ